MCFTHVGCYLNLGYRVIQAIFRTFFSSFWTLRPIPLDLQRDPIKFPTKNAENGQIWAQNIQKACPNVFFKRLLALYEYIFRKFSHIIHKIGFHNNPGYPWSSSMEWFHGFSVFYEEFSWKLFHRIQVRWSDSVNKFPGSFFIEPGKH